MTGCFAIKKCFCILGLLGILVLLQACGVRYSDRIPIDSTIDERLTDEEKIALLSNSLDVAVKRNCRIDLKNRTISFGNSGFLTGIQTHPWNQTILHQTESWGGAMFDVYLRFFTKSSYPGSFPWICTMVLYERSDNVKYKSIIASILHSFGMEITSESQRPPRDDENFIPITYKDKLGIAPARKSREEKLPMHTSDHTAQQKTLEDQLKLDAALPEQAKRDKYRLALTSYLKKENYQEALFYFELLDFINAKQDHSFTFLWGETLLKTNQPRQAIAKLHEYINKAGTKGEYYTRALELATQAEEGL